jgi:antitoxin MazE
MQARVQKWGNSLAVRIPKSFAAQSHLGQNSVVEISVEDGKIILLPVPQPEMTLAQLLEGVTAENLHGETETGAAVGQEAWCLYELCSRTRRCRLAQLRSASRP